MKKALSLILALTLSLALAAPAKATGDMGRVGVRNVVSCGWIFTAAVDASGSLWTWGDNYNGQLGFTGGDSKTLDGTPYQAAPKKVLDGVAAVACGGFHTAALKTDGSLWTWGNNSHGQLGDGTAESRSTPSLD